MADAYRLYSYKKSFFLRLMYFQEECFEAVSSIAGRINAEDADMRSHVVMSIFMVML